MDEGAYYSGDAASPDFYHQGNNDFNGYESDFMEEDSSANFTAHGSEGITVISVTNAPADTADIADSVSSSHVKSVGASTAIGAGLSAGIIVIIIAAFLVVSIYSLIFILGPLLLYGIAMSAASFIVGGTDPSEYVFFIIGAVAVVLTILVVVCIVLTFIAAIVVGVVGLVVAAIVSVVASGLTAGGVISVSTLARSDD